MGGSDDDDDDDDDGSLSTSTRESSKAGLRQRIANEVLESEKKYLAQLCLLTEYFVEPLRDGKILSGADAAAIFSNVVQIKSVSEMLLSELRRTSVGEAFVSLCPFLKQYALYASNYQRAMNTLTSHSQKQSGPFGQFLRRQESRPELQGLKLISLLITPVQRVPRYKLLLERLLKYTDESEESASVAKLKEAVRQVADVTEYVNRQVSVYASMHRAVEIQRGLSGGSSGSTGDGPGAAIELLKPWRALLKEGVLCKVSQKSGRSSQRSVFLFTDVLMYARSERGGGYSRVVLLELKHLYASRGRVDVVTASRGSGAGSTWWAAAGPQQSRALQVSCREKKLLLVAQRETEAIAWFSAIQAAVSQCRQCLQSLRRARPSGSELGCASPTASSEHAVASPTPAPEAGGWAERGFDDATGESADGLYTPAKAGPDQMSPVVAAADAGAVSADLSTVSADANSPAASLSATPLIAPRRRRRRRLSAATAEQDDGNGLVVRAGNQSSSVVGVVASSSAGRSSPAAAAAGQPASADLRCHVAGCPDICVLYQPLDGRRREQGQSSARAPERPAADASSASCACTCGAHCAAPAAAPGEMDRSAEPERLDAADDVATEADDKPVHKSKWRKRCDFLVKAGRILSQVVTSPILPGPHSPLFTPGSFND